jgi:hypothetical protein
MRYRTLTVNTHISGRCHHRGPQVIANDLLRIPSMAATIGRELILPMLPVIYRDPKGQGKEARTGTYESTLSSQSQTSDRNDVVTLILMPLHPTIG